MKVEKEILFEDGRKVVEAIVEWPRPTVEVTTIYGKAHVVVKAILKIQEREKGKEEAELHHIVTQEFRYRPPVEEGEKVADVIAKAEGWIKESIEKWLGYYKRVLREAQEIGADVTVWRGSDP